MDCNNCTGGCSGCSAALELTPGEIAILEELSIYAFLPVARHADDMTPYYPEGSAYTQEEYSAILLHLERKKLIDIDYSAPLGHYDEALYTGLKVRGSFALTQRGQQVVDALQIQGLLA